jgi:hypothetical protein
MISIPFARVSLTKWRTAASTSGCLPSFGPVKLLVVALHENMEAQAFLQRRTFASLTVNLRPAALFPSSAAYIMTFLMPRPNGTVCKTL